MKKKPRTEQQAFIRDFVLTMTRSIAEHEDDVRVLNEVAITQKLVLEIFVNSEDMGLVLGRGGETAEWMRSLVYIACKKTDFKVDITWVTGQAR